MTKSNALDQLTTGGRLEMWEAAKALVAEENHQVVPKLLDLMEASSDAERRVAAAWTLGFLRSSAALEPLIGILDNKSEPPTLRDQAAESLGYLSNPKARDVLIRNLFDENADVAFSCAFALRTVGILDDIPQLENLAISSSLTNSYGVSVAQEASEAVEQIRNRAERDSDPER